MDELVIGFDDNLGLPSDIIGVINCKIAPYHILSKMIKDFENKKLSAIFTPAGTLPFIQSPYQIIAQSLFGPQKELHLRSIFVSTKNIIIANIENYTLGRVNAYCTTSFWAPLIYLMQSLPKATTLHFQDTNGFQDMLHKTAIGQIDCSMVWDIILSQNKDDADKVEEMFSIDTLPSPVILSHPNFPDDVIDKLIQFKSQQTGFFNQYQTPDMDRIKEFLLKVQEARNYFNVVSKPL